MHIFVVVVVVVISRVSSVHGGDSFTNLLSLSHTRHLCPMTANLVVDIFCPMIDGWQLIV